MLSKPFADPVLSLASNSIGKLGMLDVESLSCIWTVFAKCAENLENGRRLENLSWRLWYTTALFCNENTLSYISETDNNDSNTSIEYSKNKNLDIPELSTSIDSASSLDEHEIKQTPNYDASKIPVFVQNRSKKPNTMQYVSPSRFQKIITDLSPFKIETERWKNNDNRMILKQCSRENSISGSPKENKLHYVSPKNSHSSFSQNIELSSNIHQPYASDIEPIRPNQQYLNLIKHVEDIQEFCTDSISHETYVHHSMQTLKYSEKTDKMFFIQETLPTESCIETMSKKDFKSNAPKSSCKSTVKSKPAKHISFQKSLSTSSFETSNNEQFQYNASNSINNDDDWDSIYGSSCSSNTNENPIFQKIDTRLLQFQLHPQRSLLSFMLQNKANGNLTNSYSKSSPAIALSQTSVSFSIPKQMAQNDQYQTIRIENECPSVISPRTIRKNMFATELSESLRKNLLWERQQRTLITFSTLKRRHTTCDVTKLSGFQDKSNGRNYDFFHDVNYSYHVAGW